MRPRLRRSTRSTASAAAPASTASAAATASAADTVSIAGTAAPSPAGSDDAPAPAATRRGAWRTLAIVAALAASGLMSAVPGAALAAASAEGVLARAERAMGSADLKGLRFVASGTGATFGQAYEPGGPWPRLVIGRFERTLDFANGAMREDSARSRAEPNGGGAVPPMGAGEQRTSAFLHGRHAWNLIGTAPVPAPVALETRLHDLWTSPHGVLAAARRNRATVAFTFEGGRPVAALSFREPGVMEATAYVSEEGLVERVEARLPHPVTGDMTIVTHYADYRSHGAVRFPSRITQSHLGQPTLELAVKEVEPNPVASIVAPDPVRAFVERVATTQVAEGVWFLAGGSHNSVVIEMKDHVVVVEAPLHDGRSAAVLAEAKKLAAGKPVRTVVNSHHHFDHAGGLRAAAAEGAELLVAEVARPYLEQTLSRPNRIKPDLLATSGRKPRLIGYTGRTVLTDGTRSIELHAIEASVHARGFTMVHLPRERLLIEADAFTPGAPNSPVPARPNEDTVNLAENIERLRLSVDRILPLHGPIVPVAELYRVIGRSL